MCSKINVFLKEYRDELYLVAVIVLVALLAFGLGRLSVIYGESGEFKIIYPENQTAAAILPLLASGGGEYVASRTGSVYYFPWCGNAGRISASNRVYFDTQEAAENAGYRPGNCSGLR